MKQSLRSPLNKIPHFPPLVWALLLGAATTYFAIFMCIPFFAIYLSRNLGMNPIEIGITVGISPLTMTFGGFFCGHLADRFGRRKVMVAAMAAMGILFAAFPVSGMILGKGTAAKMAFAVVNLLSGLAASCFHPASQAVIADLLRPELRHQAFRLRYCAINAGSAVGPLVGAWMGVISAQGPFFLTSVLCLSFAALLFVMSARPESMRASEPGEAQKPVTLSQAFRTVRGDRALLFAVLGSALFNLAYIQIESSLSQHLIANVEDGVRAFSYLVSTNGICVIVLQIILLPFLEKISAMRLIQAGCVIFAVGFSGFAFAGHQFWFYVPSMVVLTLGEILIFPSSGILIDELAPVELRATYYGSANLRMLGNALGPVVGGFLLQTIGGPGLFLVMASVGAGSALVFRQADPHRKALVIPMPVFRLAPMRLRLQAGIGRLSRWRRPA